MNVKLNYRVMSEALITKAENKGFPAFRSPG
jgi:hypothetical protein